MKNYIKFNGLTLSYYPMQEQSPSNKSPNINNTKIPWKTKSYGMPDKWSEQIQHYGIKLNDLLIIDIDNKTPQNEKPDAIAIQACTYSKPRLNTILAMFPHLADAYTEITQSGGFHIFCNAVPDFNRKQIDIGNSSVDILTGDNFLACANIDTTRDTWQPGQYAVYTNGEVGTLTDIQLDTLIKLYGNTTADIIPIKLNAAYYQEMSDNGEIPAGQRDNAIFQLMSHWYKQELDPDAAWVCYNNLHMQNKTEFELSDRDNFNNKYAAICAQESGKQESRLAWAKKNMYYIKSTDEIYFVEDRLARSLENMRKRWREPFVSGVNAASGKPKHVQLVDIWLDMPDKKYIDGVGFYPTNEPVFEFNKRTYGNLYTDQRYEPWGEAVSDTDKDLQPYIQMISNMMENDKRTVDLYFSSLSQKLNHLDSRQMWAWYLITPEKGVGKGLSWDIQTKLNGNYGQKASPDKLTNQFNTYKFYSLNILVDEADDVNKKSNGINAMNALKMLITDSFDTVHNKGKDIGLYQMPISCSVEMHSNHAEKLKIDSNERRVAIVLSRSMALSNEHYATIVKQAFPPMNASTSVKEASERFFRKLTRFLLDYKLHTDYNVERAPSTKWKSEVAELSMDKFTATLAEAFKSDNEFVKSDLQTQQTLRLMLEHKYGYKKLLDRDLARPMEELEQAGIVKQVKKAFANLESLEVEDYGTSLRLTKVKHKWNPKVYAIRDFENYVGQSTKILRAGYYSFVGKAER